MSNQRECLVTSERATMSGFRDTLGGRALAFYDDMSATYDFTLAEMFMLEKICNEIKIISGIEDHIDFTNLRSTGSMGQEVSDPLLTELRQHIALVNTLIKSLKLPEVAEIRSHQNTKAINSRWAKRGTG